MYDRALRRKLIYVVIPCSRKRLGCCYIPLKGNKMYNDIATQFISTHKTHIFVNKIE